MNRFGFMIFSAWIALMIGQPAMAETLKNVDAESSAMAEYILSKGEFCGKRTLGSFSGDIDITFSVRDEKLFGTITRGTGAGYEFDGPVAHLTIKEKVLKFVSRSGSGYAFRLGENDKKNHLVGTSQFGKIDIDLKPCK